MVAVVTLLRLVVLCCFWAADPVTAVLAFALTLDVDLDLALVILAVVAVTAVGESNEGGGDGSRCRSDMDIDVASSTCVDHAVLGKCLYIGICKWLIGFPYVVTTPLKSEHQCCDARHN